MSDLAQTWPDGVERMLAGAHAHGLAVEVRPRPPARSLPEAAELLGLTPADIAKTLVLRRSDGSYLFAVLPGDTQLAWPKLRALVGVNKLTLPDAGEALAATGYARGTITPVGSSTAWVTCLSAAMLVAMLCRAAVPSDDENAPASPENTMVPEPFALSGNADSSRFCASVLSLFGRLTVSSVAWPRLRPNPATSAIAARQTISTRHAWVAAN